MAKKLTKELKYIGSGGFFVGIPARDLDAAEVKSGAAGYGMKPAEFRDTLIESGLYAEDAEPVATIEAKDESKGVK